MTDQSPPATNDDALTGDFVELCSRDQLTVQEWKQLNKLARNRLARKRGRSLFRAGDPFVSIFIVKAGGFKTFTNDRDGRSRVTGFHLTNEILGVDGIDTSSHVCTASAIEDSEVCAIHFGELESLARTIPALQRGLHRTISREITRSKDMLLLLGTMRADQRIATLLLDISDRYARLGYSPNEFNLRMTREDMGSYLGLAMETVCKTLAKIQEQGLIKVKAKRVYLLDPTGLKLLLKRNRSLRVAG